ncbi:dolichol monophosphate mannose synthase [Agromyces rhizosphaerae]|uniref:Dolichol monophosphate mannose synthase n=1 Tax=Agromyces rhizosphaerae TaxID=88374 RepID=A0A9W6FMH4_9MICO|nr:glycosyltransferase family 2 protein [Agromyces rhizosphaerae]GLI25904.1 dolichol monophosphate mannose synthase [Agromyces rhizosphaerae]
MTTTTTIIVPTFNEAPNVGELVRRLDAVADPRDTEILFVDDSSDDTPDRVRAAAETSRVPVRLIHRDEPDGGLSGAVVRGIRESDSEWFVVMDGDLQHPPELVPILLETGRATGADVVVASRHAQGGSSEGLSNWVRRAVSSGSILLTRSMFPSRLRNCSDPMTGYFAVRRASVDTAELQPRGFKILLEILARKRMSVVEEPFVFAERIAGESKADLRQGLRFLHQLASLRFGRMSRFAVIGGFGAVLNLAIMAALVAVSVNYVIAAIVAAAVTIVMNFFLQERFVFRDLRHERHAFWTRFSASVGFNSLEAAVRLPFLALLVAFTPIPSVVAQAVTLAAAFVLRFLFHSSFIYRPRRTTPVSPLIAEAAPLPTQSGREAAIGGSMN